MATFGTFTAGQVLTAAELNGAGAWQDYTPSWTQSATISKTVNWARYTQLNKLVIGNVKMTATSGGTVNNNVVVGLPVAASSNQLILGTAHFYNDSEANKYSFAIPLTVFYNTSTTATFSARRTGLDAQTFGGDLRLGVDVAGSGGIAVASGDIVWIQFMYEAA